MLLLFNIPWIVALGICFLCGLWAVHKEKSFLLWFFLTLLLGPIAILALAIMDWEIHFRCKR